MEFSKMALIASSTKLQDPDSNAVGQKSFDIHATLAPTFEVVLRCHQLLSSLSLFLLLQTCTLTSKLLPIVRTITYGALLLSKVVVYEVALLSERARLALWNAPRVKLLRKKVEYEFFTFVLGCGNVLATTVFWPGWWIVAIAAYVISVGFAINAVQ